MNFLHNRNTNAGGVFRLLLPLWLLVVGIIFCAGHEGELDVVLDTDMAMDDARALVMLLNDPGVRIRAIVTSDGSCPPDVAATNVWRLMVAMGRTNILVGMGTARGGAYPPWSAWSRTLGWAPLPVPSSIPVWPAVQVLSNAIGSDQDPVTWLCLGPMSNLAEFIRRHPELKHRIQCVMYYGDVPDAPSPGWNTECDLDAAKYVFRSGVPILCVNIPGDKVLVIDNAFLSEVRALGTVASDLFMTLHSSPMLANMLRTGHFKAWDESVVLLARTPALGCFSNVVAYPGVRVLCQFDTAAARRHYIGSLGPKQTKLVLLTHFPENAADYHTDVAPFMHEIIARHGREEWALGVLATEMHGHLGLYSILGVKMGLRARELLGVPRDAVFVESFAGTNPPVSCLNDGLQVATGASLGRGTIVVLHVREPAPVAKFRANGRVLVLRTRPDALERIQSKIKQAAEKWGTNSHAYFDEIRRVALEAWRDLDRKNIFEAHME